MVRVGVGKVDRNIPNLTNEEASNATELTQHDQRTRISPDPTTIPEPTVFRTQCPAENHIMEPYMVSSQSRHPIPNLCEITRQGTVVRAWQHLLHLRHGSFQLHAILQPESRL